jgi:ABC-type Fe3+/spermidine/putrescine transport system ATPase subunit
VGPAGAGAGEQAGEWVVRTAIGDLRGRGGAALAPGQEVTCCIRPESLRVSAEAGPPGPNAFSARLTEWVHLGEAGRFRVRIGQDVELSGAAMPARPPAAPGSQVNLRLPSEDVIILAD